MSETITKLDFQSVYNLDEGPAALQGKEDWLFLVNDSNRCIDQYMGSYDIPAMLERFWIEALTRRQDYFSQLGIPYLFYVIPGKEYVYSSQLPDTVKRSPEPVLWQKLLTAIQVKTNVQIKSFYETMKANTTHNQLYYKSDSHWNAYGAWVASEVILSNLGHFFEGEFYPVGLDTYTSKDVLLKEPDLLNKKQVNFLNGEFHISETNYFPEEKRTILCPPNEFKPKVSPDAHPLQAPDSRRIVITQNSNLNKKRTALIFRDSFASELIPLLCGHFSRSVVVWQPDISREMVEMEKPDVVIQVMVDRFMSRAPRD